MALGRPSGANDDDCDVELRVLEPLLARDTNADSFFL